MTDSNLIEIKEWAGLDTEPMKDFVVGVWSPDFRSNEEEFYSVKAPTWQWAVLQAVNVSYNGVHIDPKEVVSVMDLSGNDVDLGVIDSFPKGVSVSVDGKAVENLERALYLYLDGSYGISMG